MPRYLCRVDENGRFLYEEEREICHLGDGLLHSAFLVFVFNEHNELMLAQRSAQKRLWPGFWDGTVASHYYKDKNTIDTVMDRLNEEIGVANDHLEFLFAFQYQAKYRDIGSENEICDVYKVSDIDPTYLTVAEAEISAYKFMSMQKLKENMIQDSRGFTPWFVIAFQKLLSDERLNVIRES